MSVSPDTVKQLFLAASEKPTAAERAAFLGEACGGDAALRRRVEQLLQAHDGPADFLDRPAVPPDDSLSFLAPSQREDSLGRLGHYEALEVIGRGGMGIVLRAFDEKLHRVVAIKALVPPLATTGAARQRFVREARAAAAVTHDNVIAIHAVDGDGPVPYLVMQCVHGKTLQEKLDRTGPLEVAEVLRIGLQIADGLAAAHRHGLVHRDVKPANILLENSVERVKITDFGLARAVDDASLTQSGLIAGTPMYMSPEQANGERVDHRSDLFSLGSVMYAMCGGRPPFRADSTPAVLKRVAHDAPKPLTEVNAAGHASGVQVWDLADGRAFREMDGHTGGVLSDAWRADGNLLATAGALDGTVRAWDATENMRGHAFKVVPPAVPWLHAVAMSPEGRYLAVTHPAEMVVILRLAKRGEVFHAPPG